MIMSTRAAPHCHSIFTMVHDNQSRSISVHHIWAHDASHQRWCTCSTLVMPPPPFGRTQASSLNLVPSTSSMAAQTES